MNMIIAIFLEKLSQVIKKPLYKEFVVLVCLYRKGLNERGWRKI